LKGIEGEEKEKRGGGRKRNLTESEEWIIVSTMLALITSLSDSSIRFGDVAPSGRKSLSVMGFQDFSN